MHPFESAHFFTVLQLTNPAQLGSRATYRQAVGILNKTTRATNPDWYRSAHELDAQWHLVVLGSSRAFSALMLRSGGEERWYSGPSINPSSQPGKGQLETLLDEILARSEFRRIRSLGVVLHIGDEFATTEIPEERTAATLAELRDEALASPAAVLGDPSVSPETTSTRVLPYSGAQRPPHVVAVTLSKAHDAFLELLRNIGEERNFPIRTLGLSAPLAFLSILPAFVQVGEGKPHFVLLHYPRFSALAVFNGDANLVQLRALPHRGRLFPGNLGDAINTALDSLDLDHPVVSILPFSEVDPSPLITQLHATLNQPDQAEVRLLRPALDSIAPDVPELRPEMLMALPAYSSAEVSTGFRHLHKDGWGLQDFLPMKAETAALYPTAGEMKMLRLSRPLLAVAAFALVGLIGFGAFSVIRMVSDPAFQHTAADTAAAQLRLATATKESNEFEHWDRLLQERSKGWMAMELLPVLFPPNSGVLVTNFSYKTRLGGTTKNNQVGFTREWNITGFATDEGSTHVAKISSRDGINAAFTAVAQLTGNQSFNPSVPGRNLIASSERGRNNGFVPGGSSNRPNDAKSYPNSFQLRITQDFTADDPMAIATKSLTAR